MLENETASPRRATIASAAATEGRSSATISRSRGAINQASSSHERARHIDEPRQQDLKGVGGARIAQVVVLVERMGGVTHRDLLRQHGGAAAELEHLAPRDQRPIAAPP